LSLPDLCAICGTTNHDREVPLSILEVNTAFTNQAQLSLPAVIGLKPYQFGNALQHMEQLERLEVCMKTSIKPLLLGSGSRAYHFCTIGMGLEVDARMSGQ